MSGSTILSIEREHYKLLLGTPFISFDPHPETHPSPEHGFHNKAKNKFECYIDDVAPKLDSFMATLAHEKPDRFFVTQYAPQATELDNHNREALVEKAVKRCQVRFSALSSVPGVLSDVSVHLTFRAIPSEAILCELQKLLKEFLNGFRNTGDPLGLS